MSAIPLQNGLELLGITYSALINSDALVIFPISFPIPFFISRLVSAPFQRHDKRSSPATTTRTNVSEKTGTETAGANAQVDEAERTGVKGEDEDKESREKRWHFVLGLETSPVIGVLVLLAGTCIDGQVLRDGIVGQDHVRPYDIMTLFICFVSDHFVSHFK